MKILIVSIFAIFLLSACSAPKSKQYLTERIQYDVSIKTENPDANWWVGNLEGPKREKFVQLILTEAFEKKTPLYDCFSNKLITDEQLEHLLGYQDTMTFQNPDPPYNDTMMIVDHRLNPQDITRVRFLEEWVYNGKDISSITKNVLGIAPLLKNYDENGNFRGYQPLFWIYFTDQHLAW